MSRVLAVALWPVGLAVIASAGAFLARRGRLGTAAVSPGPAGRCHGPGDAGWQPARGRLDLTRPGLAVVAGAAIVYGIMTALGFLVVRYGPGIDKPIFQWIVAHRVHWWARVNDRLTKVGDTWTTWGACLAAATCLAVTWRGRRWLPPAALAAAVAVDHFTTLLLRHTFHRIGPPGSPGGTYPSGAVDRVVLLYGLIAYLLWRGFSGRRTTAIWAGTAVAALAFTEAYSRAYLTLHWFTDTAAGGLYGCLLLAVFIAAVRLAAAPTSTAGGSAASQPAAPPAPALTDGGRP